MSFNARQFVKDRDNAFIAAVMDDDWEAVRKYLNKYGMKEPGDERVLKAGIYKAVHECTDIPDEVKLMAALKCARMGFKPTM